MIKIAKELRVFQNTSGFYVRPVSREEPDRGLSLGSEFEKCEGGLKGSLFLDAEFNRIRHDRSLVSVVLLSIVAIPHIYLSMRYGSAPKALSVAVIALSFFTLLYQSDLLKYRYQDRTGTVYNVRDSYIQLKDGTRIRIVGGD